MMPYKSFYGRKLPVNWDDLSERVILKQSLGIEMTEKMI